MNRTKKGIIIAFFITFWTGWMTILPGQILEMMKKRISQKTLPNGMTFIVMEQHEAPVISFHIYADVGSAQEVEGITGISHVLEHMAFKGTHSVGTTDFAAESKILDEIDDIYDQLSRLERQRKPDEKQAAELKKKFEEAVGKAKQYVISEEFLDMLRRNGDVNINAYTSTDATQYVNKLPSNRLEFWMAMTSDRFLNPVFREFYKERDVIMEERRLGLETQPTGKLVEDILAVAFKAHAYHHSTIGHMSDLKRMTRRDVESYFRKFYSPSNLTAAVVGDVDPQEVFRMAEIYFSRIPGQPKPEEPRTEEPEQWGERQVTVEAQSQPVIFLGYKRPSVHHADDTALKALADIIGQGRSSRLWESMVKKEKTAVHTGCFNGFPGVKYPNLIAFYAVPSQEHTNDECLKQIEAEIEKIKKEPVAAQELTKFKQIQKKSFYDLLSSNDSLAESLTYYQVMFGDCRLLFDRIKTLEKLTPGDIQRVATTYLVQKNRTVGRLIPEPKS